MAHGRPARSTTPLTYGGDMDAQSFGKFSIPELIDPIDECRSVRVFHFVCNPRMKFFGAPRESLTLTNLTAPV